MPVADIITPGYTMSIPREGFPKPGGGKVHRSIKEPVSNFDACHVTDTVLHPK